MQIYSKPGIFLGLLFLIINSKHFRSAPQKNKFAIISRFENKT